MGFLIVVGIFLIIYVALGFLYYQQGAKQEDLREQINNLRVVVSKPLPGVEKLTEEYDDVNHALLPLEVQEAIRRLVDIAEESGINVDQASGKFDVPPPGGTITQTVGGGTYQVLAFRSVRVQGDYDSVMAFVSDLDSGKTMETMVLKNVNIGWTALAVSPGERVRGEEFRNVALAMIAMMTDNITEIPNPINYAGGTATNYMGDNPDTEETVEGFPDITTTAAERGYTGTGTPRDGYVLYEHDKIPTDNTSHFETVSYMPALATNYYYTCEADGTVRQFDGADVATATEYPSSKWEARRTEVYSVSLAVIAMMTENRLSVLPLPLEYAGGIATNDMGSTLTTGFPDITTTAAEKGYTGTGTPRDGYVLYKHDKISTDNITQFETVSYIPMLTTEYYYTCEADGTVRQFDGPDVATAIEYVDIETVATLDVDLYTKPLGGD
ncbi:hypothetical protein ES703_06457 [subsurface metagenome]